MKIVKGLTVFFTFLLLFANSTVSKAQPTNNIFRLPVGTQISLKMDNEINSRVSNVNDTFTATVSSPVIIREVEVLPVGATVEGKIIGVKPAASGHQDGSLELQFEMLFLKTFGLFIVTACAEIIGCYLPFLVIRRGKPLWLLLPAAVSLGLFAWLLTHHPGPAGRTYAAYGAVYVATAIFWLWAVERQRPDLWDFVGAVVILLGMGIIILAPRK